MEVQNSWFVEKHIMNFLGPVALLTNDQSSSLSHRGHLPFIVEETHPETPDKKLSKPGHL